MTSQQRLIAKKGQYELKHPLPTGGKAGKNNNQTSSIQVFDGNRIIKQFRYVKGNIISYNNTLRKAKKYIGL